MSTTPCEDDLERLGEELEAIENNFEREMSAVPFDSPFGLWGFIESRRVQHGSFHMSQHFERERSFRKSSHLAIAWRSDPLSVRKISETDLRSARLAFLSLLKFTGLLRKPCVGLLCRFKIANLSNRCCGSRMCIGALELLEYSGWRERYAVGVHDR